MNSESKFGGESNTSGEGDDWSILEEMAGKREKSRGMRSGPSEKFREEEVFHRANAEEFYKRASSDQKEALAEIGIRDAQDAGEFLHEAAAWKRQVGERVKIFDANLETIERELVAQGHNNGVDPVTGERTEDSPFTGISDERARERWQGVFRDRQEELLGSFGDSRELRVVSGIIMREIGAEQPDSEDGDEEKVEPRSAEALEREAADMWLQDILGDGEKLKKLKGSVLYSTLKRKIEKELKKRDGVDIGDGIEN